MKVLHPSPTFWCLSLTKIRNILKVITSPRSGQYVRRLVETIVSMFSINLVSLNLNLNE